MSPYEPEPHPPLDKPLDLEWVEDELVFIGPGSLAFAMTREAAAETSRRLRRALQAVKGSPEN